MTSIKQNIKEDKYSLHHILPKSRWWANSYTNLEMIKDNHHRALHVLFQNQLIAEQLITTVNLSAKALRDDVRQWILETLWDKDIHNPYARYREDAIK